MLRSQPFLVANIATLVAGVGFFAYLLTNVLWLQYVWQYSVLEAGLALVPGALVAAITAGVLDPSRRASDTGGSSSRGSSCGGGIRLVLTVVDVTPDFLGAWLPGQVLSGSAWVPRCRCWRHPLARDPAGRTLRDGLGRDLERTSDRRHDRCGAARGDPGNATRSRSWRISAEGWMLCIASFVAGAVITLFLGRLRPPAEDLAVESIDLSKLQAPASDRNVLMRRTVAPVEESLFARLPSEVRKHIELTAPQRTVPAGEWMLQQGLRPRRCSCLAGRARGRHRRSGRSANSSQAP